MVGMATPRRKPATKPKAADTHKPSRMVRIPERVAQLLEELAAEQFNTLTDQVRAACVSRLVAAGKVPKPNVPPD